MAGAIRQQFNRFFVEWQVGDGLPAAQIVDGRLIVAGTDAGPARGDVAITYQFATNEKSWCVELTDAATEQVYSVAAGGLVEDGPCARK